MGFTGTEIRRNIYHDPGFNIANGTWYSHRKLVRNNGWWFACFDRYGDNDYNYQTIVLSSIDGSVWEDTNFPFVPYSGIGCAYPNLAVDTTGVVHLVAYDLNNQLIRYAVYSAGAWGQVETLPALPGGGYVDTDVLVLVDSQQKPHLVFSTGGTTGRVYYTNRVSGSWATYEVVQPGQARQSMESAAMDAQGYLHITMRDYSNSYIYYTKGSAAAWAPWEQVYAGADANGTDLAVDSTGKPYLLLSRSSDLTLYIKTGAWLSQQVANRSGNTQPNLHISAGDKLYLAWTSFPVQGYTKQQVLFTTNEGGAWAEPVNLSQDDTLAAWAYPVVWSDGNASGVMAMNYDYANICGWFTGGTPHLFTDKWGDLQLNLIEYNRDEVTLLSAELDLIAFPTVTTPQSRLLSAGSLRERRSVRGWAAQADFDSLEQDYLSFAKRQAEFHDGTSLTTAIIERLSANRIKGSGLIFYELTFLEV